MNAAVRYVIRPRSNQISLRVDTARREAVLIMPRARDRKRADALLSEKKSWLDQHWQSLPPPMPFVPGGRILLRGQDTLLRHEAKRGIAHEHGNTLIIACPDAASFAGRTRRALIALARKTLSARAALHAAALNTRFSAITVRDTASRWGSCSQRGRLNFSWRLICAPDYVLDYVCAHEVAHLLEHNHSPRFWAQVAKRVEDVKAPKNWLRANSPQLFAVGAEQ